MSALSFTLPKPLEATRPPARRDRVRLLVASIDGIEHARFDQLGDHLRPGDLLVINTSATLPAALSGLRGDGTPVRIHVSTPVPGRDDRWRVVELRSADGASPLAGRTGEQIAVLGHAGEPIAVPGGQLTLTAPYTEGDRLMVARTDGDESLDALLARDGEPIQYGYAEEPWPLAAYQTVYATQPGSAEMPSAGRPFSRELIVALVARGITIAPIVLHCGVSSPERHEPPYPEPYAVPAATARLVNDTHRAGGRVIAVGTSVVRALETVAGADRALSAGAGWTDLVITPQRGVAAVDGLITGWHEPEASHLLMLEAIAGPELLSASYEEALRHRYRWHEFGDSHLILP
jgi:S-adenosylmethionine:tRNA ribosyltransferase-isomerase